MATNETVYVQIAVTNGQRETFQAWIPKTDADLLSSKDTDVQIKHNMYKDIIRQAEIQMKGTTSRGDIAATSHDLNIPIQADEPDINSESDNTSQTTATDNSTKKSNNEQMHVWTVPEEKLLIEIRSDRDGDFNNNKQHDTLWNKIRLELQQKKIYVTKNQIINKWKNLKRKYKEVVDENSKTGNRPSQWKHFETFNSLYGNKASTKPALTIYSGKVTSIAKMSDKIDAAESSDPLQTQKDELPILSSQKKKQKRVHGVQNVIKQLQVENKAVLDKIQEQHTDKMARMDRFLDIFEKMANNKNK